MRARHFALCFCLLCILFSGALAENGGETMKNDSGGDKTAGGDSHVALEGIRLRVLYDNYPYGRGFETKWGFSCLIEGTRETILFDTGGDGATLMKNIEAAEIDPRIVDKVFLSHVHWDHTGGLERFLEKNSDVTLYLPASFPDEFVEGVKATGAETIEIDAPQTVSDGVLSTGEMGGLIKEQSLVIRTDAGLIVITGCAHPGIVDIVERAKEVGQGDVLFVFGGFHLGRMDSDEIERIVSSLRDLGVAFVGPSHCTGDNAIHAFKAAYGERFVRIGAGRSISAADLRISEQG